MDENVKEQSGVRIPEKFFSFCTMFYLKNAPSCLTKLIQNLFLPFPRLLLPISNPFFFIFVP